MKNKRHLLSVILPTFNERANVVKVYEQLKKTIDCLNLDYEIVFVDDNSPDGTVEEIKKLRELDNNVKYILMASRCGMQISLMAGVDHAKGDILITMDADLQHPPEYIPLMIDSWHAGYDIVIMKREKHAHFFREWSSALFYKLLNKLSRTPIYFRFSGFLLINRKAANSLKMFCEKEPFFRGLIGLIGFKKTEVYYKENQRMSGETKFRLFDLLKLVISGITSFSEVPLYASFYLGIVIVNLSILYTFVAVFSKIFYPETPLGWTSIIMLISFFGGVQLISIGLLGIYLSKVFIESKGRPRYIIYESAGILDE